MSVHMLLTAEAWAEIEPRLTAIKHKAGSPPELSDRWYIETVLYLARTGLPWRDLPAEFGHWDAVYNRFRRWEARGIWRQLWACLQAEGCEAATHVFIDRTIVRSHQHAAGARKKNGGQGAQALGRSRGGFSTKVHVGCLDDQTSVSLELTSGARHGAPVFETVFGHLPALPQLTYAVMDQGYDRDAIRQRLQAREVLPVIPPKRHRKKPIADNTEPYQ
jgi:transposase